MISMNSNAMQVRAKFEAATTSFKVAAIIANRAKRASKLIYDAIRRRTDSMKRSGKLSKAVYSTVRSTNEGLEVVGGVNLGAAPYGRILEVGGTIRPKNGKFLTIPVGVNRDARGIGRVSAPQFISNPGVLGFVGSFVTREKTAIMGKRADGSIEPVFALKTSVKLKKVGYMAAAKREASPAIRAELKMIASDLRKEVVA